MAGRGPAPKTHSARARDHARRHGDQTVLPADGYQGPSPDLPKGRRWLKATREWWETWRHAPQAATFGVTEWSFLAETAVLVDEFHRGDTKQAAEIRLRVGKLGATPEDRLRLRMTFGQPDVGGQGQVEKPSGSRRAGLRAVDAAGG